MRKLIIAGIIKTAFILSFPLQIEPYLEFCICQFMFVFILLLHFICVLKQYKFAGLHVYLFYKLCFAFSFV